MIQNIIVVTEKGKTMSRPIDADVLREMIEFCHYFGDDGTTFNASEKEALMQMIDDAPTIEAQTWIPCSERLPTEEEQDINLGVLVTLWNGYKGMDFDWYHDGRWYDWGDRVIAWMPLPKPYEEGDHE